MGVIGTVTGGLDHLAGSVDESIDRQFDDSQGGGFFDVAPEGSGGASVDVDGDGTADEYHNRFLQGSMVRTAYDAVFTYDGTLNGSGDSVDVLGPTTGGVVDAVVDVEGEDVGPEERKAKWLLWGIGALVVLYLIAPLLDIVAGVIDG